MQILASNKAELLANVERFTQIEIVYGKNDSEWLEDLVAEDSLEWPDDLEGQIEAVREYIETYL